MMEWIEQMKVSVKYYVDDSLVDTVDYVLSDGMHKEDPTEFLRIISWKLKDKRINKLKTIWYWDSKGTKLKQPKNTVFGFRRD